MRGFIDALREGGGVTEDVNDGQRSGLRLALAMQPTPNLSITPRFVYQHTRSERLQPPRGVQPLRQPLHHHATDPVTFR